MKTLSAADLQELIRVAPGTCISIYMSKSHESDGAHRDRVLFKNLLKQAKQHLLFQGMTAAEAEELLNPAQALLNDDLFWYKGPDGLVLFVSAQGLRHYQLPFKQQALVVVAHHFYVTPLLSLQEIDQSFYILALSQNQVRLLQGSQYDIAPVNVETLPKNLQQALANEVAEKQSGFRSLPASTGGGGRQAIFYGQGAGPEENKDEILRYFRVIDSALHDHLKDKHMPLVLAAVDYLFPLYRRANTYPYLTEKGIAGNPEDMSIEQLHTRAWDIVQPQFKQAGQMGLEKYRQMAGTGLAAADLEQVLPAAFHGRVQMLFLDPNIQKWGDFDPTTASISVQPLANHDGEELLNLAAIYTLSNGGEVFFTEPTTMHKGEYVKAIYRY